MSDVGALTQAVRSQAEGWTRRGYVLALLSSGLVLVLTVPRTSAALLTAPSLVLAAVLLLTPQSKESPKMYVYVGGIGLVTLAWAVATGESLIASAGLSICLALWISRRYARTLVPSLLAWAGVTAIASLALFFVPDTGLLTLLLLSLTAAVWLMTVMDAESQSKLLGVLEQAKDAERELSLLRERERFAADLHDVQGHSLHVVKLKAAVVEKTMGTDHRRATEEIREIQAITADAISQGRELARATHRLDLLTEAHNAQNLLRSAGISADIVREGYTADEPQGDVSAYEQERALVLREATTNILRHTQAQHVTIALGAQGISVTNDGVEESPGDPQLRGLATLRRRVADAGGDLQITRGAGTFQITAAFQAEGRA